MATAVFIRDSFDTFLLNLKTIEGTTPEIAKQALYEGARVYADAMKTELKGVLSEKATGQLVAAFGITPFKQSANLNYTTHLGFDGYQILKSGKKAPFQLIARAINSGAYKDWEQIIKATHFAENAVKKNKEKAERAMIDTVNHLISQKLEG